MIIYWEAVEQYFTVMQFGFQFYPVCNFGKFITFGLSTVMSEGFMVPGTDLRYRISYECTVRNEFILKDKFAFMIVTLNCPGDFLFRRGEMRNQERCQNI